MYRSHWILLTLVFALGAAGCRKPEKPKSAKRRFEEALAKSTGEQMALDKFTAAIRETLQWRESQEMAQSEEQRHALVKTLTEKMMQVPIDGLSPELSKAWEDMLQSWQALAAKPRPDESLRKSGAEAARQLNQRLESHGVIDIRF